MQEQKGTNNVQSLFLVKNIPVDNWIRKLLDPVLKAKYFQFSHIFSMRLMKPDI